MKPFLFLASLVMLASAEPPTSYSSFTSGSSSSPGSSSGGISFQNVPSVATLQYSSNTGSGSGRSQSYSSSPSSSSYGAPSSQPSQSQSYGTPSSSSSSSSYSGQSSFQSNSYSLPPHGGGGGDYHGPSQPANIQVSYGAPPQLPPGSSYGPPPIVTGAGPDHEIEYRVVYKPVKAPKPDLVLPPPPPKQKTIVYILVPRFEPPEPIIVPTHAPTPPSKPEVYFIRYKAPKKNKPSYGPPSLPSSQYGVGSAPKPVIAEPPQKHQPQNHNQIHKKREVVSSRSSDTEVVDDPEEVVEKSASPSFGDRVVHKYSATSSSSSSESKQ